MNAEEFEEVFESVFSELRETLFVKAREYASDGERMHNFKAAAAMNNSTPEQALWGFVTKQIISTRDMIQSGKDYPEAAWKEKLGDILVYMILLRGLTIDTGRCVLPRHGYIKSEHQEA